MILWGLVETELQQAVELFFDRAQAEDALADVLRDKPEWEGLVVVEPVAFIGIGWN